ncbi:outer membrane beta-barrel protein [Flammeovirga sp. EKP202]|uniref:outer membrane beta-barrel protein n=1 Tax=Flammeovirga sp. EKP202 TaxID=2770592 RepID=UPI00165EFB8E|nr:outer membrane beta-barrel protein [Flammeovirga sp. EKP202]MBD0404708.1 PorT family protein [Flammeovirga sp. EKP202]
MKKILTLFIGLLLIGATAQAQDGLFSFGIKGGIGASNYDLSGPVTGWSTEGTASWHVGGMFRTNIPVLPIYAQVEALYSRVGGTITLQGQGSDDGYVNRFDVPIVVGLKFGLLGISGRVFGGAVAQSNFPEDADDLDYNNFTWGWQAGIGADIKKLTVDVKYESGSDLISQQLNTPSIKATQWILSVGYFFGG